MNDEYILTEKANFPENDDVAIAELAVSVGLVMDFIEEFVTIANKNNPESMNLWNVGRGLQSAAELYFINKARA